MLNCIDNSGAAVVECIQVFRMKRHAKIGDRIQVVVQKQRSFGPESGPGSSVSISAANKVRRGDIRNAVVVRTKKKYQRKDGSVVGFDDNACVLVAKNGEPIGSRLNGELPYFTISTPFPQFRKPLLALERALIVIFLEKVSWVPSCEIKSGQRSCHWRQCMFNSEASPPMRAK